MGNSDLNQRNGEDCIQPAYLWYWKQPYYQQCYTILVLITCLGSDPSRYCAFVVDFVLKTFELHFEMNQMDGNLASL